MNTDGSYTCTCRDGFTGVGTLCIGMCYNINLIYPHIPKKFARQAQPYPHAKDVIILWFT